MEKLKNTIIHCFIIVCLQIFHFNLYSNDSTSYSYITISNSSNRLNTGKKIVVKNTDLNSYFDSVILDSNSIVKIEIISNHIKSPIKIKSQHEQLLIYMNCCDFNQLNLDTIFSKSLVVNSNYINSLVNLGPQPFLKEIEFGQVKFKLKGKCEELKVLFITNAIHKSKKIDFINFKELKKIVIYGKEAKLKIKLKSFEKIFISKQYIDKNGVYYCERFYYR